MIYVSHILWSFYSFSKISMLKGSLLINSMIQYLNDEKDEKRSEKKSEKKQKKKKHIHWETDVKNKENLVPIGQKSISFKYILLVDHGSGGAKVGPKGHWINNKRRSSKGKTKYSVI